MCRLFQKKKNFFYFIISQALCNRHSNLNTYAHIYFSSISYYFGYNRSVPSIARHANANGSRKGADKKLHRKNSNALN